MSLVFDPQKEADFMLSQEVLCENRRILVCELIHILKLNDCFDKVLVDDFGDKISARVSFAWENNNLSDNEFAVVCDYYSLASEFILVKDFVNALNEFCKIHPRAKTMEVMLNGGNITCDIHSVGIFKNCVSLSCYTAKNRVFRLADLSQEVDVKNGEI